MHPQPVALVTGGSRGIGRGICVELARLGHAVAINYAGNEEAARQTQQLLGPGADSLLCRADVSRADERDRMVDEVLARWGRIDVLVNNAGITSVGRRDILEATEESWERVLGVNLKGPYFLTQRVAREMIRLQREEEARRTIVNISSLSAYAVSTNRGDYCISKAGLAMLTQLFALRLAEYGIHVYEVRPGIIETDMTAGAHERYTQLIAEGLTPIRRWGTPADVGRAVATLVTGAIPFSTGDVVNIDGGFHLRRFPV
ncbi:MAG TPA: 3-ketoacyl-ACP reductase [Gemmataceae bacterium]|jgi:NAD(P)-dependent dehydrogenase (short-subunit alcohol dehydrogenase family)|nr:3-ketoacyl-ACP reductase [Gemmataceae bacterium]